MGNELDKIWKGVLAELEVTVSPAVYKTHFKNTRLVSLENGVARVGFELPVMRSMVEMRYYTLVKNALDVHTKQNVSVLFVLMQKTDRIKNDDIGPLFREPEKNDSSVAETMAKKLHIRVESTFSTFAVSTTNQMAYAAATAVAKSPGTAYNPLFFYGGVGVGKTHLMHAVANTILSGKPNAKIVYCTGEEFLNEIVDAIQTKTARQFKQKYRSANLFLVDDVQFIAGKQTAQEEFFHTFNAIHGEGGQIILTSDRSPSDIAKLEDRLRSRFEGGLIVDISPPDFELRTAIINIKAQSFGLSIVPEIAQIIAANTTDTRAIEGVLRRVASEITLKGAVLTEELISKILKLDAGPSQGTMGGNAEQMIRSVSSSQLLELVAVEFNIKSTALKGQKRDRPIARPRQVFMYLARTDLGLTHGDIGGALGGRDHTTIMHGVETITKELATNTKLRMSVDNIRKKLRGGL